jgi:hypothetical protein
MNNSKPGSILSTICAFVIGVILLWSFGRNWLAFDSALVFLVGLIGVAIPVVVFGLWKILHHSREE